LSSVQGLVESGSNWGIDVSGVVGCVSGVFLEESSKGLDGAEEFRVFFIESDLSSVQGLVESWSNWGIDVSGVVGGVDSVVSVVIDVFLIIMEDNWSVGNLGNVSVVSVVHVSGVVGGIVSVVV